MSERIDVCPNCAGESVYACGCCPDCGRCCNLAPDQCETRMHDCDPIDYDDDSQVDDHDPYEE